MTNHITYNLSLIKLEKHVEIIIFYAVQIQIKYHSSDHHLKILQNNTVEKHYSILIWFNYLSL